jgi:hypothetical protein
MGDRALDESVSSLLEYVRRWCGGCSLDDDGSILAVEIGDESSTAG